MDVLIEAPCDPCLKQQKYWKIKCKINSISLSYVFFYGNPIFIDVSHRCRFWIFWPNKAGFDCGCAPPCTRYPVNKWGSKTLCIHVKAAEHYAMNYSTHDITLAKKELLSKLRISTTSIVSWQWTRFSCRASCKPDCLLYVDSFSLPPGLHPVSVNDRILVDIFVLTTCRCRLWHLLWGLYYNN